MSIRNIDGDIFGPEEEEFDIVFTVNDGERFGVASTGVACFAEDVASGVGKGAFVGDGYFEHGCLS